MLRVEFHSHTIYSKDSLSTPENVLETCRRKKLDRIVITDHNTTAGALAAKALDPQMVIVGEEIMTTQGELLAAFMKEEIPPGLEPGEAIQRLREQDAFISVSHPFDVLRKGHWQVEDLLLILPHIDAIETFNARCMRAEYNQQAQEFADKHNMPGTVGSDAHSLIEIGKATFTVPDFSNADELRTAIRQASCQTSLSSPLIHFSSRWAVWRKSMDPKLDKGAKKP